MACQGKNLRLQYNPLKKKINLRYILIFSSYRAVNILCLGYKNQSINDVLIVKYWFCGSETHTMHVNTLCRQTAELFSVKLCGPKVTTGLESFNGDNQRNVEVRRLKTDTEIQCPHK